jgi:uncharacterized protein YndB with AHSA1/START domain
MQSLDVKFVTHHGEFIKHKMAGREELAGRDVILVHRFLKNEVNKTFGTHAYALYSDACVQAMGIDPVAQGLVAHVETIDILGEVKCWVRDLEDAWTKENETKRTAVQRADAVGVMEFDIAAPRPTVWEHITVPGHRVHWQKTDDVLENAVAGRRGAGTQNHCMHGKDAIIEEILDWRPFDYVTFTTQLPIPGSPKILMTYAFEERSDGGTHVELRVAKPKPKDMPFLEKIMPTAQTNYNAGFQTLRSMLEGQSGAPAVVDEPSLPVSGDRFHKQPIHAQ